MGVGSNVHVQLLDRSGATVFPIFEPQALTFSSKLPGGCYTAGFGWLDSFLTRALEYDRRRALYCEITDDSAEVIWFGRRKQASLGLPRSDFSFLGLWDTLNDVVFGFNRDPLAGSIYVDDLLGDLISQVGVHLEQDKTRLQHNPLDLTANGLGDELTSLHVRSSLDVLVQLLDYSDTAGNPWSAAVWPDRVLEYFPRETEATHFCSVGDLAPGWQLQLDASQVYSSVILSYTGDDGNLAIAGPYTQQNTAEELGYSTCYSLRLPSNVTFSDSALDAIAQLFLQQHRRPRQTTSGFTLTAGYVTTVGQQIVPAAQLRAGHVLAISDLPVAGDDWGGAVDDLRVFPLGQVSWQQGQVSVVPDYPVARLDALLARAGVPRS